MMKGTIAAKGKQKAKTSTPAIPKAMASIWMASRPDVRRPIAVDHYLPEIAIAE
ncbi:hypothetical protein GS397_21655 [Sphingobium yanoikuyae]|uniref:Uncharacterized protein n=1 Tax=Sphingobium yanoikuyae TaxID=13690 RepID=A0A6P1GPR1_SPHYA|nr:hypothetical protein [Sphingobium yanoikuyae]QHD69401.1 hypothetical protein GS397_21655 [Sphingobium yanoikuyae]